MDEFFYINLFKGSWMDSFTVFIEFNLNVNCVKTITFSMKIFIIFLFQRSWMPSFTVFKEFNLNVNWVKTITFSIFYENFHYVSVSGVMHSFLYGIYRIQFKCKLCKDNNFCYKDFHIFLLQSSLMPSFTIFIEFYINVNCVNTITFVMKIFIIFLFQSSCMASFMVFIEFNLNVYYVKTLTFLIKIFIIFPFPI